MKFHFKIVSLEVGMGLSFPLQWLDFTVYHIKCYSEHRIVTGIHQNFAFVLITFSISNSTNKSFQKVTLERWN